jgi:hypothetical protein
VVFHCVRAREVEVCVGVVKRVVHLLLPYPYKNTHAPKATQHTHGITTSYDPPRPALHPGIIRHGPAPA